MMRVVTKSIETLRRALVKGSEGKRGMVLGWVSSRYSQMRPTESAFGLGDSGRGQRWVYLIR